MICRLFLMQWALLNGEVTNPLTDWMAAAEEAGQPVPYTAGIYYSYPTPSITGAPDKPMMLGTVRGVDTGIEQFDAIQGVYMLPPSALDKVLTTKLRNSIASLTDAFGVPSVVVAEAATVGDVLDGVVRHMQPSTPGFEPSAECDYQ